MTARPTMSPDDAQNVVRLAADDDLATLNVPQLVEAAGVLETEVRSLNDQLEQVRAAARRLPDRASVEGHEMILGESEGGPRFYLDGQSMHAGDGIHLLTVSGWLPGRYEYHWSQGEDLRPFFHFTIAGVYQEVSIRIPPHARLAWPSEFARRPVR